MNNTSEEILQKKLDSTLLLASKTGDLEMVKFLVEDGANVKYSDNNGDALTWASCYGHLEVVKYLIDKGWNIHLSNDLPIRFASENGHLEVVKYLAINGCSFIFFSETVRTASERGYTDVSEFLIELYKNKFRKF